MYIQLFTTKRCIIVEHMGLHPVFTLQDIIINFSAIYIYTINITSMDITCTCHEFDTACIQMISIPI